MGLGPWCGTHRHHDPSISFGAFEAIQSWATLKPTGEALVKTHCPQASLARVSSLTCNMRNPNTYGSSREAKFSFVSWWSSGPLEAK